MVGTKLTQQLHAMEHDGHVMLPNIFSPAEVATIAHDLDRALRADQSHQAAIARGDTIVAARNILEVYPPSTTLWRKPQLLTFLTAVLGTDFGLMRGLYFDKPPGKSWALPWHQDRAIAVKHNRLPSTHFGKPTTKAGVPHVESPLWLSQQILMLRIHLDPMTEENGPLHVLSGSHHDGSKSDGLPDIRITAAPGDVLAMRPLLLHRSEETKPGCTLHRRILHLEFTACSTLPDGYEWHTFVPGAA
jgi:hypothetical protein